MNANKSALGAHGKKVLQGFSGSVKEIMKDLAPTKTTSGDTMIPKELIEIRQMVNWSGESLKYVNNGPLKSVPMAHHKAGLSYTRSGYGSKIPSEYKTKIGTRWYRIYYMVYSNSGTPYIISQGETYIVKNLDVGE